MQKLAGLITESQFKQLVESLEQDIINFWGTLQDDAAQSEGEYEAEWDTQFFIEQYPEYSERKKEITQIVKKLISENSVNEALIADGYAWGYMGETKIKDFAALEAKRKQSGK